jgi:Domain of unknown function (DUF4105)
MMALIAVSVVAGCSNLQTPPQNRVPKFNLAASLFELWSTRPKLFDREPTLYRKWRPDLAVLPYADIERDLETPSLNPRGGIFAEPDDAMDVMDNLHIVLHNVRNCRYRTEEDYDVRHYDLEFDLHEVEGVDFIIVPFKGNRLLAHTMLSFRLRDGQRFVVSVEARLEQGETYTTVSGPGKKFELMYLIADERDMIPLRTEIRQVDVHIYPGKATPGQTQRLLVDILERTNKLAREPEFYDILKNNCTTNLVDHVNKLRPGAIPFDWRVVLPGHSDSLAYELGLLDIEGRFDVAQKTSKINSIALLYKNDPAFSDRIRGR